MMWKWLGALLLFPVQMVYLVVKAAVCLLLPPKLRDLSRENVLVTGGGRGIGRHLAREFARRGARKVSRDGGRGSAHLLPHLWVGSLGRGERSSPLAELSHGITYISEVVLSSFPASCLSPSIREKAILGQIPLVNPPVLTKERFLPQPRFAVAGEGELSDSVRGATARFHCCFLALLGMGVTGSEPSSIRVISRVSPLRRGAGGSGTVGRSVLFHPAGF